MDVVEQSKLTRYTLLTNLSFVQVTGQPFRLECHALLIAEGAWGFNGPNDQIRGFGMDAAWPTFTYYCKPGQMPFTLIPTENPNFKLLRDSPFRTENIFQGSHLKLADGTEFFLQADDSKRPLDVYRRTGEITVVWQELERRTYQYADTPNLPVLTYMPKTQAVDFRRRLSAGRW